jgi:hypothetical protein
MATLQENMQNVKIRRKNNVKRNNKAYEQALSTTTEELARLLEIYQTTVFEEDMRARLYRDSIDHHIRRYHKYAIQGRIKSHYHQRGVSLKAKDTIFEHVIPAATVRDKLIAGELSIMQALNVPTCRISRVGNKQLEDRGLHDNTPDAWFFFKRYVIGIDDAKIETYNGTVIADLDNYTLQDHFDCFGIV